ncbi:MAG: aminotransferase class V-fold PLP-dependent enzyme, partial [Gemmatimonadota bacterium]
VSSVAEFPTVAHVWLAQERRGARVHQIEAPAGTIDVGAYVDAIDERARIVSIPLGLYLTGHMPDVAPVVERARAVGALVFCDAYQVAGARSVDAPALGVDVLASGCVKYLLGTAGIAFAYVRPEAWASMEPAVTGWFGRSEPFAYDPRRLDWADGARRLDTGTPPILPAYVARAALDELSALGMAQVGEWTAALAEATRTGAAERGLSVLAAPRPGAPHTPTTSVLCHDVRGGSAGVEVSLRERGVLASARGPVIRLSPHAYNTLDEVDVALDALADLLIGAPRGASATPPA